MTGTEMHCGNCGCAPCACKVPGFVTYAGYSLEQALASVGDGWAQLIRNLFEAMPDDVQVHQVKEKFGGLRFYTSGAPDSYHKAARAAESASLHICETCGKPGELKTPGGNRYGWWKTVCDTCHPDADYKKPWDDRGNSNE